MLVYISYVNISYVNISYVNISCVNIVATARLFTTVPSYPDGRYRNHMGVAHSVINSW